MADDPVVGLLHLAQAAEAEAVQQRALFEGYGNTGDWYYAAMRSVDAVERLAAGVVALLERLERAEAVCAAVEAQAQFSDRTHGEPWVDVMAEDRLLQDTVDDALAAWRGVTGLQGTRISVLRYDRDENGRHRVVDGELMVVEDTIPVRGLPPIGAFAATPEQHP